LKIGLPSGKAEIMTDFLKFDRIMSNLLNNAIKFSFRGEVNGYKATWLISEFNNDVELHKQLIMMTGKPLLAVDVTILSVSHLPKKNFTQ